MDDARDGESRASEPTESATAGGERAAPLRELRRAVAVQLVRVERLPPAGAMALAVGTFVVCLPPLMFAVLWGIPAPWEWLAGIQDSVAFAAATAVVAVIDYLVSRAAYRAARWKTIRYDGSRCWRCHYDLTGNTSGTCPECGLAIDQLPPACMP